MKFDVPMKQFKVNTLRLRLSKIDCKKGNNCGFSDCVKNNQKSKNNNNNNKTNEQTNKQINKYTNFNVGMRSGVYEWI